MKYKTASKLGNKTHAFKPRHIAAICGTDISGYYLDSDVEVTCNRCIQLLEEEKREKDMQQKLQFLIPKDRDRNRYELERELNELNLRIRQIKTALETAPYWISLDGSKANVRDMMRGHLINCLRVCVTHDARYFGPTSTDDEERMRCFVNLIDEARRRKIADTAWNYDYRRKDT